MKKVQDIFEKLSTEVDRSGAEIMNVSRVCSPLGDIIAVADEDYLYLLEFADGLKVPSRVEDIKLKTSTELVMKDNKLLIKLKNEMKEYFDGNLKEFNTPYKFFGTDFQKDTWNELSKVKFGETLSYGQLASRLGKGPAHSRAVGACAGANKLLIIIPCHRLIASQGKQGGFSAGGDRKTFLINHEKKFK